MIITIKANATDYSASYLSGLIVLPQNGEVIVPQELNVILSGDAEFIKDVVRENVRLNLGVANEDYVGGSAVKVLQSLAIHTTSPLATMFLYHYFPISVVQSTTAAAGTVIWALRNLPAPNVKNIVIEEIQLKHLFSGATPLAEKTLRYELMRFSGATPTGGSAISPLKGSTLSPNAPIDARQLDTGLTIPGGLTFASHTGIPLFCPAVRGAFCDLNEERFARKLAPGEGIAIRIVDVPASVGQCIFGKMAVSLR